MKKLLLLTLAFVFAGMAKAEDGHKLWLRQTPVNKAVVTGPECIAAQELRTYSNHDVTLKIDASMPRFRMTSIASLMASFLPRTRSVCFMALMLISVARPQVASHFISSAY